MYVSGDRYDVSSVVWCGVGRRLMFDVAGLGVAGLGGSRWMDGWVDGE